MKIFNKAIKIIVIALLMELTTISVHAQNGNVLDFDGVNDYIQIPDLRVLSPATIQFWVKVNGNNGNPQSLITSGGSISNTKYYGFSFYAMPDGKWYFYVDKAGTSYLSLSGPSISYGAWTNIAGTYDGGTLRFYVNGILVNSVSVAIAGNSAFPTRIGAGNSGGTPNYFFGGQMDELSFWTKALSPSQINSNMNGPLSVSESNLLFYYNFNEGVANGDNTNPPIDTFFDSKNNKNGTLYNFALNGISSNWVSASALPVNLVSFSGTKKDGYNLLQWSTASEQNTGKFEIQRSEDGNSFATIGTVSAAGNSDRILNYTYDDRSLAASPVYYYRLRMVDLDGSSKYSDVVSIKNSASQLATVYPNPARDQITITVADKSLLNSNAVLTDLNGKVMQKISLSQPSTTVNVSSYTRGMYVLKFGDGSTIKIVKE